jgi:hypothetical protein
MIGFNIFGNILLKRESGGSGYPTWIFAWPVGLLIYTYAGASFSEMVFQNISPTIFANGSTLVVYTVCFLLIQHSDRVYRALTDKRVFVLITTWWLADATRASLLTLERAVTYYPSFSRGVWQSFFWCTVAPLARCIELAARGLPIPPMDSIVPNTVNAFKHPVICMFFIMIAYLCFMTFMTDCNLFATDGSAISMTTCGDKNKHVYAAFVYLACVLHLVRGYCQLYMNELEAFCGMRRPRLLGARLLDEVKDGNSYMSKEAMENMENGNCMSHIGHCDKCGVGLVVGPNWFHKRGCYDDLCRAHWLELPKKQQSSFVNVRAVACLRKDAPGYTAEGYTHLRQESEDSNRS